MPQNCWTWATSTPFSCSSRPPSQGCNAFVFLCFQQELYTLTEGSCTAAVASSNYKWSPEQASSWTSMPKNNGAMTATSRVAKLALEMAEEAIYAAD